MSAKDAVATMGDILPADAGGRDAVHVAVVSAVAMTTLRPGQDVGIGAAVGADYEAQSLENHIGIVDPFLKGAVMKGQRFWLFLYPRTITGLSHVWSHPAFEATATTYTRPSEQAEAMKWLNDYASPYGFSGQDMIDAAKAYLKSGDYLCDGGTFEGERVPDEFWDYYQKATGEMVDSADRGIFYSCSC